MICGRRRGLDWCGLAAACLLCVGWPDSSSAYITFHPPTLGSVVASSTNIMLVQVEKVSREKSIIIYRKVRDIKGKFPKDVVKHIFGTYDPPQNEAGLFKLNARDWSYVLQWAEPGKEAVIMGVHQPTWGHYNHIYVDQCWYGNYCPRGGDLTWWHTIYSRPDMLRNWYCGSAAGLAAVVEDILAGKEVVVPVLADGSPDDLRLGRAKVRGLKAGLKIRNPDPKGNAADWSDSESVVEALVRQLKGQDDKLRLRAARELQQWFGPVLKAAVPALAGAVEHGSDDLRRVAATALANRSLDAGTAVPALAGALKNKDRDVRLKAAEALAVLGAEANAAVPVLIEALKGKDSLVAEAAAAALICIDPDFEAKVPAITAALERRASVGARYRILLRRFKVPQDLGSLPFQDRAAIVGMSPPVADYLGHKDLPGGYWVYVYPYWYIWAERTSQ